MPPLKTAFELPAPTVQSIEAPVSPGFRLSTTPLPSKPLMVGLKAVHIQGAVVQKIADGKPHGKGFHY